MLKLFGTDGIRCRAGEYPLDRKTIFKIGLNLPAVLKNKSRSLFIIGEDTRESCSWISDCLAGGLTEGGALVQKCGVMPTPSVAYITRTEGADAGISISASHNLYHDNGLKIFDKKGYKLSDELESMLENLVRNNEPPKGISSAACEYNHDLPGKYEKYLKNTFSDISLKGIKVAIDCANGANFKIAGRVFSDLGSDIVSMGCSPDGKNINKDCGSQHPHKLSSLVVETSADIGVAFDGDGDRAIFVSSDGTVLDGDFVMFALAKTMKGKGTLKNSTLVSTVMSNLGLENALAGLGIKMLRTDVGDRQVLESMIKGGHNLGGEQSGHVICLDHATTGDGLLTALKVLEIMAESGRTLREITEGMSKYPQILVNVKVREKPAMTENKKIQEAIMDSEQKMGNRGRVLVRYSGTEPLARIMLEGDSESVISKLAEEIAGVILSEIGA